MRRFRPSKDDVFNTNKRFDFSTRGLGYAHEVNFWFALEHVGQYTHSALTVLRIEAMTLKGDVMRGEYERFRITKYASKASDKVFRYEYKKYATDCK